MMLKDKKRLVTSHSASPECYVQKLITYKQPIRLFNLTADISLLNPFEKEMISVNSKGNDKTKELNKNVSP